ncbi:MAG: Gx transporter family protein [Hydrogenoanaerobacterium sp.]
MNSKNNMAKTRRLVLTSLFFATSLVLSLIENALPPLPFVVPGVKLGLSNVAVMYALFFLGQGEAFIIAALKAGFVVLLRGPVAGFLSLSGGLLSVGVMALLLFLFGEKISYLVTSICGAVCHNIGQFAAISLVYTNIYLWVYLPVLLVAGVFAGVATSALLAVTFPILKKLGLQ